MTCVGAAGRRRKGELTAQGELGTPLRAREGEDHAGCVRSRLRSAAWAGAAAVERDHGDRPRRRADDGAARDRGTHRERAFVGHGASFRGEMKRSDSSRPRCVEEVSRGKQTREARKAPAGFDGGPILRSVESTPRNSCDRSHSSGGRRTRHGREDERLRGGHEPQRVEHRAGERLHSCSTASSSRVSSSSSWSGGGRMRSSGSPPSRTPSSAVFRSSERSRLSTAWH